MPPVFLCPFTQRVSITICCHSHPTYITPSRTGQQPSQHYSEQNQMPPSSMERCLGVAELLSTILFFMDRPSQARLAQCCRRFLEPAVDALWSELDSLAPLLRTMPHDVWAERHTHVGHMDSVGRSIVRARDVLPWSATCSDIARLVLQKSAAASRLESIPVLCGSRADTQHRG
jgi:hypothetical protein